MGKDKYFLKSLLTLLHSSILQVSSFLKFSPSGPTSGGVCPGQVAVLEGASLSKH